MCGSRGFRGLVLRASRLSAWVLICLSTACGKSPAAPTDPGPIAEPPRILRVGLLLESEHPSEVQFRAEVSGEVTAWEWEFGGGRSPISRKSQPR